MDIENNVQNVFEESPTVESDNQLSCEDNISDINEEEIQPVKKKRIKKYIFSILLGLLIIGSILTYMKLSENVIKVEKMINNMGEISINSKSVVRIVEESFNGLSELEKN